MSVPGNPHPASAEVRTRTGAQLPPRVRAILDTLLQAASPQLEHRLDAMLVEFEQQLLRLAQQARTPVASAAHLQTLSRLRLHRGDLIRHFLRGLEARLLRLDRTDDAARVDAAASRPATLALVDENEIDAELMLRDTARRCAARASLPLYLLGQRFGVLAAAPAFDAERLPLGPWSLCVLVQEASIVLQLPPEPQLLLLRAFEREAMADYETLAESFNTVLAEAGVLPALRYVPVRLPPSPAPALANEAAPAGQTPATATRTAEPGRPASVPEPPQASRLPPSGNAAAGEQLDFPTLQALLAARRAARPDAQGSRLALTLSSGSAELAQALHQLRASFTHPDDAVPDVGQIKREVLVHMRARHGTDTALSQEDNDTFDLLGMFYERIEREVRPGSPAAALLRRLQLPVLHIALRDRAFFTRQQHPARELLNAVAESGARWLGEYDADPLLVAPLRRAVDHAVRNAHQDPSAFEAANQMLQHELQLHARRADMAERRHVEAARGREKLEIARAQVAEILAGLLAPDPPPKFVRALIEQAWADVLTLALLRHGTDSEHWRQLLDITRRMVQAHRGTEPPGHPELAGQLEAALAQIGHHASEAAAIARHLAGNPDAEQETSRTELAVSLKTRARPGTDDLRRDTGRSPPRTPEEQAQYERVRALPVGTWIEFLDPQGEPVRRRLAWYSMRTGTALFVNPRGQRVEEQTLDGLARAIARGQARVVMAESARPVDRAWQATLGTLRGVGGRDAAQGTGAGT